VLIALGFTYFFSYYDITAMGVTLPSVVKDFNVSAGQAGIAITGNLLCYIVGAYCLGTLADYIGRRRALMLCVGVLTAGGLLTALSWNLVSLTVFRCITGFGTGAQIALAATWISEMSSKTTRGRNLGRSAILGGFGFLVPALIAFPLVSTPQVGWRVVFGVGALVAVLFVVLNKRWFPESPRWLAIHGRQEEAEEIVAAMEQRAQHRAPHATIEEPVEAAPPQAAPAVEAPAPGRRRFPTLDLIRGYPGRLGFVFGWYFLAYLFVYAYLSYETTLLGEMGISLPNGLLYTTLGLIGFPIGAIIQSLLTDRIERKYVICFGLLVQLIGVLLIVLGGTPATVIVGGMLVGIGDFPAFVTGYTYASELFPTRARGSAMALCDGLGHLGGAVQPFIVGALLAGYGAESVFWFIAAICALAAVVMLSLGQRTKGFGLTELARS
jgi:putative MFS transporter